MFEKIKSQMIWIGVLVISIWSTEVPSAMGVTVSLPTDFAVSGQEVVVPVLISGVAGSGIGGYALKFDYDEMLLSNPRVMKEDTLSADYTVESSSPSADGIGKLSVAIGFGFSASEDGTLIKVKFDVAADFADSTDISFVNKNEKTVLFKPDFTNIEATFVDGSLTRSFPPPTDIEARSGVNSVRLRWTPGTSAYLAGYNVYRSSSEDGPYAKISKELVTGDHYVDDSDLINGNTYYYYLTSVDSFDNEGEPSDIASALFGQVKFFIPDSKGESGTQIKLPVNISNADGLEMCSVSINVNYDSTVLSATDIEKAALSSGYGWAKNFNTPGIARAAIADSEGDILQGEGSLFYILFDVKGESPDTSKLEFEVSTTYFYDCKDDFNQVPLNLNDVGIFTVTGGEFILGDVNGDAIVDEADFQLVLEISVGNLEPTEDQINAGDVSGNGRIETNDATLIKRIMEGEYLAESSETKRGSKSSSAVTVSVPSSAILPGDSTWIPIDIDDASDVTGADIILNYDPSLFTATDVRVASMTQDFEIKSNTAHIGQIGVSLSSKQVEGLPKGASGTLVEIQFTAKAEVSGNRVSPLTLASIHLNDSYSRDFVISALQKDVRMTNGSVKLLGLHDLIQALKMLAGMDVDPDLDISKDEKISMEDVICILQAISGIVD